jgi:hypothetical protein
MFLYLVLLQVGFTVPRHVATRAVRSYRTISPLPNAVSGARRYIFCGTFRGLTPPRGYLAPCRRSPDFPPGKPDESGHRAIAWPAPDVTIAYDSLR